MKNSLFIFGIVLLLLPVLGSAQIVYIDTTGVSALKKTTTIFVIPKASNSLKAEYEQAIRSSWKITPYKIVTVDELAQYAGKKGYSFFCELCFGKRRTENPYDEIPSEPVLPVPYNGNKDMSTNFFRERQTKEARILGAAHSKGDYSYYSLFTIQKDDKGDTHTARYADIKIGLAGGHEPYAPNGIGKQKWHKGDNRISPYWNASWNPGLLKIYLHVLNNDLSAAPGATGAAALQPFRNSEDAAAMRSLISDTLYIPDYIESPVVNGIIANRHSALTDTDIEKDYPYPHRLVSSEQLSNLILNSAAPVNFLTYNNYEPVLLIYDGEQWAKEHHPRFGKNSQPDPGPAYQARRGIKVYNSEKGIIYAYYVPSRAMNHMNFSEEDVKAVADAAKNGHPPDTYNMGTQ